MLAGLAPEARYRPDAQSRRSAWDEEGVLSSEAQVHLASDYLQSVKNPFESADWLRQSKPTSNKEVDSNENGRRHPQPRSERLPRSIVLIPEGVCRDRQEHL